MKGISVLRRALLVAGLLALVGCGYHFPGGGGFPAGIRSVYLEAEPEDSPLALALEDVLSRDTTVELMDSPQKADATLRVEGGEISSSAAAIGESGVATEYEVTVQAGYRLVRSMREGAGAERVQGDEAAPEAPAGEGTAGESPAANGEAGAMAPSGEPGEQPGAEAEAKGPAGPKVIRKREGLQVTTTYPYDPASNPAAEEANKRRAGEQASEELAESILESIKSGF